MIRFLPCPNCRRHVNSVDALCPFCDAKMDAVEPRATLPLPMGRLSRIAVLAAGASLTGGAASCADSPTKADAGAGGQVGTGGLSGMAGAGGGANGAGGGAGNAGTGGGSPVDAGQEYDGPIAIYAAAIALPKNKT